jgi:hypothetical protein
MQISTRTRRAVSTVLAVVLAVETVTAVAAAAATRTVTHPLPVDPPAGQVLAAAGALDAWAPFFTPAPVVEVRVDEVPDFAGPPTPPVAAPEDATDADAPAAKRDAERTRDRKDDAAKPRDKDRPKASGSDKDGSSRKVADKPSYSGTNHVWIPELGINKSVRWFPCDRERPPDNDMYRWGCAGTNNVYLMGHASSVMEPLHDAYVSGRLHKGMKAHYADARGKVHVYAVRWWKVTKPTTDAAWAWASQDVPSMTLQTCVGRNSQYRLMVRLVEVDR